MAKGDDKATTQLTSRLNYGDQVLNKVEVPNTFASYDPETADGVATLGNVCSNQFVPNALASRGTFKAICLSSDVVTGRNVAGSWVNDFYNLFGLGEIPQKLLSVKARIPELHACIPNPLTYPLKELDQKLINMHPTFIATDESLTSAPPVLGDIINVDFGDRINFKDGKYLGSVFKPGSVVIDLVWSSRKAFDGSPSTNLGNINRPPPNPPGNTEGSCEETQGWDDKCAWVDESWEAGKNVELVPLSKFPNHKLARDAAKAWDEMAEAAAAANPPIVLKPNGGSNAAFRTMKDQKKKYDAWQAGRGNKAAYPGTSKHQSGQAIDIKDTHKGGFSRSTGLGETYRWLLDNAHKYGFVRTEHTESWHWVYKGIPAAPSWRASKFNTTYKGKKA